MYGECTHAWYIVSYILPLANTNYKFGFHDTLCPAPPLPWPYVGPHGAGLYNVPLFSPAGTVLLSFTLWPEHESKESNLVAVCAGLGLRMVRLTNFQSSFFGNYTFDRQAPAALQLKSDLRKHMTEALNQTNVEARQAATTAACAAGGEVPER